MDVPGALHHIMVRGIDKTNIFRDDEDKARFLERLGQTVTEGKFTVYAWALMDNHVHISSPSKAKPTSGTACTRRR